MEIIILILAGIFVIARIVNGSAQAREKQHKQDSKDELVQRMLDDYR